MSDIALSFLPINAGDFEYQIYRRRLAEDEPSVPGTRALPEKLESASDPEKQWHRFAISYDSKPGFEPFRVTAWLNHKLTVEVLHQALRKRCSQRDLAKHVELEKKEFVRRVAFVLGRSGDARQIMWLRPYEIQSIRRFGFLLHFALRVPHDTTIPVRRRLELSLTHKNGRLNEDYYLDQFDKVEQLLSSFYEKLSRLTLHDGTTVELERVLPLVPTLELGKRTYVFANGKESNSQFFGLRDHGPLRGAEPGHIAFLFSAADRIKSQDLYRALRGDTYSTFPGMQKLFGVPITRENVSGTQVDAFSHEDLIKVGLYLQQQHAGERVVPLGIVPLSKHKGEEETQRYYAAKHAFLSQGLYSQFVDRKRLEDRNALKWSISNIGLALFAKLGGAPWRVKPSTERCLIVGIGQAHRKVNDEIQKYLAYSVLTDSSGMYESIKVLGSSSDKKDYLEALKARLREVLLSHRDRYDSFVLHVTFSIRKDELNAIRDMLKELQTSSGAPKELIALKFNDDNDFFGFSASHNSRIPTEGTIATLSPHDFLVWFSGLSLQDSKVPKKPERPVHVRVLYPQQPLPEADVKRVLQDAMNIAGTNWRGFNAKSMPISIYYAKLIAEYYGRFDEAGLEDIQLESIAPWFL